MAGVAPIQPLPPWMSRTYLPIPGSQGGSTLVTIQFPQTYSGPNTEGLGWPWTVPGDSDEGTLVSIVDGAGTSLIRIGGPTCVIGGENGATLVTETTAPDISQTQPPPSSSASLASPSAFTTGPSSASTSSTVSFASTLSSGSPMGSSVTLSSSASSGSFITSTSLSAQILSDTSSSASTLTTSSTSTSAPIALPTPSALQDPSSSPLPISWRTGISPGVIVAIVIATIAFLAGLILLLAALFLRRRRRRKSRMNDSWSVISPPDMAERNDPDSSTWNRGIPFSAVPFNSRDRTMSGASQCSQIPADEQEHLIGYRDEGHEGERDSLAELGGIPSSTIEGRPRQASNSTDATQPSSTQSSSTGTRSSLIAQFPTFRKPSDGSGSGSPGAGAGGPNQGGAEAARGGRSGYEGEGPSPGTMNSTELFYSPPARPASGRRTVPAPNPLIGLGRPTDALATSIPAVVGMHKSSATTAGSSGVSSRLFEQNRKDSDSTRTDTTSEPPSLTGKPARPMQTMSNAIPEDDLEEGPSAIREQVDEQGRIATGHTQEASLAGWLKGFSFLRPYLGSPSGPRTMSLPSQPEEDALLPGTSKGIEAPQADSSLIASSAPVARDSPSYRRVTTTAAAYDTQDLVDLAARNSARRQAGGNESSSDDENGDQAANEGRSFLGRSQSGSNHLQASPASPTGTVLPKPGARRWSGATLGQPIRRVSNMSSLSLTDLPESIASSIASARQRNKSRSRSGSVSHHSSNPLPREHSGSAASLLSMKSSTSRKSGSRRGENSSGGSGSGSGSGSGHGSLERGSRRSNKSESSQLHRVSEVFREDRDAPEVPQLPSTSRLP